MYRISKNYVAAFAKNGISEGDVVAVCTENQVELICLFYAALYLGITVAPMNFLNSVKEMTHSMALTKPKIVFCTSIAENIVMQVVKKLDCIEEVVVFGKNKTLANRSSSDYLEVELDVEISAKKVDPATNIALILSSSGTTGASKGVLITQKNVYYLAIGFR